MALYLEMINNNQDLEGLQFDDDTMVKTQDVMNPDPIDLQPSQTEINQNHKIDFK